MMRRTDNTRAAQISWRAALREARAGGEAWAALAAFLGGHTELTFAQAAVMMRERPGAGRCATREEWLAAGCRIREGERAVRAPGRGGGTALLFEESQIADPERLPAPDWAALAAHAPHLGAVSAWAHAGPFVREGVELRHDPGAFSAARAACDALEWHFERARRLWARAGGGGPLEEAPCELAAKTALYALLVRCGEEPRFGFSDAEVRAAAPDDRAAALVGKCASVAAEPAAADMLAAAERIERHYGELAGEAVEEVLLGRPATDSYYWMDDGSVLGVEVREGGSLVTVYSDDRAEEEGGPRREGRAEADFTRPLGELNRFLEGLGLWPDEGLALPRFHPGRLLPFNEFRSALDAELRRAAAEARGLPAPAPGGDHLFIEAVRWRASCDEADERRPPGRWAVSLAADEALHAQLGLPAPGTWARPRPQPPVAPVPIVYGAGSDIPERGAGKGGPGAAPRAGSHARTEPRAAPGRTSAADRAEALAASAQLNRRGAPSAKGPRL